MTDPPRPGSSAPGVFLVDRDPVFRALLTAFRHRRVRLGRGETASPPKLATSPLCRRSLRAGPKDSGGVAEAMHRRDSALLFAILVARREPARAGRPAFLRSAPLLRKPIDFEDLASIARHLLLPETQPPLGQELARWMPGRAAPLAPRSASVCG